MTSKVVPALACSITLNPIVFPFPELYILLYMRKGQVTQIRLSDWFIPKILASDWLLLKPLPFTTDESLATLMGEVESIVNGRPI